MNKIYKSINAYHGLDNPQKNSESGDLGFVPGGLNGKQNKNTVQYRKQIDSQNYLMPAVTDESG
ncbi:hypothetical protein GCM10023115_45920 [Pontixanthobacter gangjinensis]